MKNRILLLVFLLMANPCWAQEGFVTFERVWDVVEEKFYDAKLNGLDSEAIRKEARAALEGVDNPEEVTRIINGFLGRLNASHTRLFSEREPDYYELLDVFFFGAYQKQIRPLFDGRPHYHGILTYEADGKVVDVVPGGPAALAGLEKGDRIVQADGRPYHSIDSFKNKVGQPVRLQVARGDSALEIDVRPEDVYPQRAFLRSIESSAKVIPGEVYDVAYVRMWSYAGEIYQEKLKELLAEKFSGADGLLLDLRGRWGGAQPQYLELFAATPKLRFTTQSGETSETDGSVWNKPVGLVTDSTVSSGKEVLAAGFRKNQLGPVIGERTQGSLLGGSLHLLPDGYALYLATVDVHVDGQRLEGLGVGPSYQVVNPTPEEAARYLVLDSIKKDIVWRADLDQSARLKNSPLWESIDHDNTEWAKRVVEAYGWPRKSLVGEEPAHLFWLLVQHTPDLEFQEKCLALMTEAVESGEADPKDLAYLYDRVQLYNKKPQKYGTQLVGVEGGGFKLWIVEDPEGLDSRRVELGMRPIREYLRSFKLENYESLDEVTTDKHWTDQRS